jgi:hypothetical protein
LGHLAIFYPRMMDHLLAQHDFEVVVTSLVPLIPFMSGKSCEEGTSALVKILREVLETQEAASKRAEELKNLEPKSLVELLTPESGKVKAVASPKKVEPAPVFSYVSSGRINRSVVAPVSLNKSTSRNKKMKVKEEKDEERQSTATRRTRKRTEKVEEAERQKEEKLKKQKSEQKKKSKQGKKSN